MKGNLITVHNSLMGGSARIARMFDYPTTHIDNYYDQEGNQIILIVRQPYLTERALSERGFIEAYFDRIIGVIVADDKTNGFRYGEKASIIQSLGIPIIAIIDRVLTIENRIEIERWLEKHAI